MLIYAFCVIPIVFAQIPGTQNMWLAVIVIGIAAAAHQAWSANIFTTVSDMSPKSSSSSVTGIGGIALSLFIQKELFVHYRAVDKIETAYYIMFIICGSAYLLAWRDNAPFSAEDETDSIVIAEWCWIDYFRKTDIIFSASKRTIFILEESSRQHRQDFQANKLILADAMIQSCIFCTQ